MEGSGGGVGVGAGVGAGGGAGDILILKKIIAIFQKFGLLQWFYLII